MATKKAQSKASGSDMSAMLKWVYVAGVVVAGVAGMGVLPFLSTPIVGWLLLLVGLVAGFFYFDSADVMNFGLRYLILGAVAAASASFLGIGGFVSGFLNGFYAFLGPVVLAQIVMYFAKKYFM